jgi:hypothetical protein
MDLKTELKEYTLWFDGTVEIDPSELGDLFLRGIDSSKIAVTSLNSEVTRFNSLSLVKVGLKDEVDPDKINFDWLIPQEYLNIDIPTYVWKVCESKLAKYSGQELEKRIKRVETELKEYERRNLFDILRVLIFVIDEFKKQNIVWGVGRGSSCASYILFLIEVHSVDPVKYSIPLAEFFK